MKKSIAVIGGYRFVTMIYKDGSFIPLYNYVLNRLNLKYNVTNYAKDDISLKEINKLVRSINLNCYEELYLSLGEYESNKNISKTLLLKDEIKEDIISIFDNLRDFKGDIKIELLPEINKTNKIVNEIVKEVADLYKIKIINNDGHEIKLIGNINLKLSSLYI